MARRRAKKSPGPSAMLLPDRDPSELQLTFAGNIVKHLGVQMYAGRPVPAIAELISNAWDADATKVEIQLPLDEAWDTNNNSQIIQVSDDGDGMNWEMVRDAYLDVGRDRRESDRTDKSSGGRSLLGRKGIGKLAGFGIADVLEVQTIYKEKFDKINQKALIWFRLNLTDLKKIERKSAPVSLIYAGPVAKAPAGSRRQTGTTIVLRELHQRKALNSSRFHNSIAQRFLLIGPNFRVRINGADLTDEKFDLQWRWPEARTKWADDEVKGCGPVSYWIGFTPRPRQQNKGQLSGILIYTRNKISQEATFFDISGGVTGQHGLRYMVGMVKAEWLDAGFDSPDLIATHRGAIAWESPQGAALQEWGQKLVKDYLKEWARRRQKLREKQISEVRPNLRRRIERLAPAYREIALGFVEKFKTIEMEPGEFEEILSWFLDALENATLLSILKRLRDTDAAALGELDDLLSKMEVRIAVALLQIIDSNLAAIEALEKMHHQDARERGVLSKHLEKNPWLIDPTWMLNKAEGRVATWIRKEFNLRERGDEGDSDRADFFCVGVGGTLHIVEIKRGQYKAMGHDILQADKYREYVCRRFEDLSDPKAIKYTNVQGHLIAADLHASARSPMEVYANSGNVLFTTWDDLIERAKHSHTQFREVLKRRAEEVDNTSESSEKLTQKKRSKTKSLKPRPRSKAKTKRPEVKRAKKKRGKKK